MSHVIGFFVRAELLALVFLMFAATGHAQSRDHEVLLSTRSFKCTFPWQAGAEWDSETPTVERRKQEFGFHLDGVDVAQRKARIIGNAGSGDLAVVQAENGLTFIEITPSGYVNLTTIFVWGAKDTGFKAVHSRHVANGVRSNDISVGGPVVTQSYGFCRPWE